MNLTSEDIRKGAQEIYGRSWSKTERGTAWNRLEFNGHTPKGKALPRFGVLFGRTLRGLCPLATWTEAGGKPENLGKGNYVIVPEGSRDLVWWWEEESESFKDGPDWYGRPNPPESADYIIKKLAEAHRQSGTMTATIAADALNLSGSTKRDRRARARTYLAKAAQWHSLQEGRYYNDQDPEDMTPGVRDRLFSLYTKMTIAFTDGMNAKISRLGAEFRFNTSTGPSYGMRSEDIDIDPLTGEPWSPDINPFTGKAWDKV